MTTSLRRTLVTAMGAAALSLAAPACNQMIDGAKVEQTIKDTCAKNGVTLSSVTCPRDQKVQQGGTFTCASKTADGADVTWDVTQTDAAGSVDFKSTSVMDQKKLGDMVEPQLTATAGGPIDMQCPSKWIIPTPGAKFSCDATLNGKPSKVDCVFSAGTNYDCQLSN